MTEPTNPLMIAPRKQGKGMPVTREQLEQLAASLNRSRFVHAYGWFYFVGNTDEGKAELRRNDHGYLASQPIEIAA